MRIIIFNVTMGNFVKKIVCLILLFAFINMQTAFCAPISGHIQKDENAQKELDKKMFTGEIDKLDGHDVIKLTVSQVLSSGYTLEGDEFFAEVTSDVEGDKGVIIPSGTIAHGIVKFIEKKLGLKVNATKSKVDRPRGIKYLGYGFYKNKSGVWKPKPHLKSIQKFKRKLSLKIYLKSM